jgi:signal transduction histidine kinase
MRRAHLSTFASCPPITRPTGSALYTSPLFLAMIWAIHRVRVRVLEEGQHVLEREQWLLVSLSVSDDGVGFTPDGKAGGLGLMYVRESVYQLHGTFDFASAPSRGTRVRATVPFRPAS